MLTRKLAVVVVAVLLVVSAALYVVRVPLRGGYLGPVSVSVQGYQTNATGQVTALVAITNGGSHIVDVAVGTQLLRTSGWVDALSGMSNRFSFTIVLNPQLAPGSNRVVSVAIPAPPSSWRAYVMCQKRYPDHWSKSLRWISDAYVLKRGVVEQFYSQEIQR